MFGKYLSTALILGATAFGSTVAQAKTIEATLISGTPAQFRWVRLAVEVFVPTVNKELEGSGFDIKWDVQVGGSLVQVGNELEAVGEGLGHIGTVGAILKPGQLPLATVTYFTPFVTNDPVLITNIVNKLYDTNPKMHVEWAENGLVRLGGTISMDDYLLITKFPVNSIEDLKGKKIGAPGAAVNWLNGTGAIGVGGNIATYYNDVKTGVYDGVVIFASVAVPTKIYEAAPYVTRVGFGSGYAGALAANKKWHDALPDVVKKALKKGADAYEAAYLQDLNKFVAFGTKKMNDEGVKINDPGPAFREKWVGGMENIAQNWAKQIDAKGKAGSEILKAYMDAARQAGAKPVRNWDQK